MNILVTGATSGFGAAIARRFIKEGHRVVATGRRTERLATLAAECGERLHALVLDVRDREAIAQALASLPAVFVAIEVLVNNAGLAWGLMPGLEADLAVWVTQTARGHGSVKGGRDG